MLLHHQIAGQGAPIIVIHGLFGSLENLSLITRELANSFRVISIDVRNHGHSFHTPEMTYDLMSQDVMTLANHLAIDKFSCLGHSMGGKIAMRLALNYPDRISKLIIADIAPVPYPDRHAAVIAGLQKVEKAPAISSRAHAELLLSDDIEESAVRQFLLKSLVKEGLPYHWRFNVDAIYKQYPHIAGWPAHKGQYSGEVRFIKGGDSDYLLPEHKNAIARYFPAASAKVIPATGHWLHAEKPRLFNRLCLDFLT